MSQLRMLLAIALLFVGAMSSGPRLSAAEQPEHATSASNVKSEQELHEAEEGTTAFKHSGPVKFIAKLTGLSLENAYWLCVVFNFALIAVAIFWAAKKNLPTAFKNRTASIQQAMAEARAASEDANRRLKDIESRLSRLDSEISEMRGAAEKEGTAEEERIKAATAGEMQKVVASAEQEIAAAAKSARRELREYAADLVVSLAEKQIKVDPATDQALVQGFAKRLVSDSSRRDGR
jgi:F-type H+-transporting ATPase subunit b